MQVEFITSAHQKRHYPPPGKPEIAFAGRSNVGKSSLINVLVNRKGIARTSSQPGRTQAINFFCIDQRLFFVDLPGYGYARVPLRIKKSWQKMVETYLRTRPNLRAVIVILDIRREPTPGDRALLHWLTHYGIEIIPVLTKADKLSRPKRQVSVDKIKKELKELISSETVVFSARNRMGREELWERIWKITAP
jgi:GTP-binding protein